MSKIIQERGGCGRCPVGHYTLLSFSVLLNEVFLVVVKHKISKP